MQECRLYNSLWYFSAQVVWIALLLSPWVVSEIPWYAGHPTPTPLSCRCSAAGGFPHTRSLPAASSTLTHLHYRCVYSLYDESTENICRWQDLVLHCSTGTEKRDSQSHGLKNSCRDDNSLAFKSFVRKTSSDIYIQVCSYARLLCPFTVH